MARRSNSKFGVVAIATDKISPVMRKAARSIMDLGKGAVASGSKASGAFAKVRKALNAAARSSFTLKGALERIGHRSVDALIGAVAGVVRSIGDAVKAAADFGNELANVQTISDKTVFSTERITKVTDQLAKRFGVGAIEGAKALYQTISAGTTDAAGATELLNTAAKLSIGGQTDLTTAVDGLTNVVNSYKAAGLSAADASDVMFVAIKDGKTTADELATSLGQVTPLASQLGVSFPEVAAAIATITTNGVATAEAVTQVRSALVGVLKNTPKAKAAAKELGIDFSTAALKAKGLKKFLEEIANSGATESQLLALFGRVEGLNAVLALNAQGGAKFNEILSDMAKRLGMTDEAFGRVSQEMKFQMDRYGTLSELVTKTMGTVVNTSEPAVRALKGVNAALERMVDFFGSAKGKQGVDAFFSLLNKGLIVATDATRSMVRAMAALTGSDDLRNAADELFEIHKALELARQGFDQGVGDRFLKEIAQKNVEAFQEIIATRNALNGFLRTSSLEEKSIHLQRIAELEQEVDERRQIFEDSRGTLQPLLEAERAYAKVLMSESKPAKDEDTESTEKNTGAKVKQLAVLGKLREMSGSARLAGQRETIRLEGERIEMLASNEKRVDAIREANAVKESQRQRQIQAQYQQTANTVMSVTQRVAGTLFNVNSSIADNFKATGKLILDLIAKQVMARIQQHFISQSLAKKEIGAQAALGGAAAGASAAQTPVVGWAIAPIASAAVFALLSAFASKFQKGGMVPGSGRGDTVPALLEPGEFVVPRELVSAMAQGRPPQTSRAISQINQPAGGGATPGGGVTIVIPQSMPQDRVAAMQFAREHWVPILTDLGFVRT